MIGDMILPKKIPNLNHILFKGDKIFEFIIPKIRKRKEITSDHSLKLPSLKSG